MLVAPLLGPAENVYCTDACKIIILKVFFLINCLMNDNINSCFKFENLKIGVVLVFDLLLNV